MNEKDKYTRLLNTFMNFVYHSDISGPFAVGQMNRNESIEIRKMLNYKMDKQNYYVLGNSVSNSPSPIIHQAAFDIISIKTEFNYNFGYLNIENEENFKNFILNKDNLKIASITIPFKENIYKLVQNSSEECKYINCANTLNKINDNYYIYNSDFMATYEILLEILSKMDKKIVNVLIIGAGGASLAIILACKILNINNIFVYNRTTNKSIDLAKRYDLINFNENVIEVKMIDIVISTIPSKADLSFFEIPVKFMTKDTNCIDLAYCKDENTNFFKSVIKF